MILNLITFVSSINKNITAQTSHENILGELENNFTVNLVDHSEIEKLTTNDFSIVFVASGGVERMVAQCFESLPRPAVILADGMQNSLAAAMEISAWLRGRGVKSEILHGDPRAIVKRIKILYSNFQAQRSLLGTRIGVLGKPAPWLIASNVDYLLAKRRWGIEYVNINLQRIYEKYDLIDDESVGEDCAEFARKALACREGTPEDMLKAMRIYRAIKEICLEENLKAITLNCFKLIELTGCTGCMALSLLNDDGIMAGCEGDLQSIFTMLAVNALTQKGSFMANPSLINSQTNEVIFSHCSVGIKQTERYIIRNHYETEKGISIQGILPTGDVTIVKCGGESLDEYYLSSGILTENTNYINMCRTQARVKLNTPSDYFLKNPLGNHHIVVQGNFAKELQEFFLANSCKRIE